MAPPRKPQRRNFFMPPATTPETLASEQKTAENIYEVLRNHIAHAAATRAEVRALRNELHTFSEDIMKISELSSSIDRLIGAATAIKNQPVPVLEPLDDPAVEELNAKILRAIAVLEGHDVDLSTTPFVDPNSPA